MKYAQIIRHAILSLSVGAAVVVAPRSLADESQDGLLRQAPIATTDADPHLLPPLSSVHIMAVRSGHDGPWEIILPGESHNRNYIGGTEMEVRVVEVGGASRRAATFRDATVFPLSTQPVCFTESLEVGACEPGLLVAGTLVTYRVTGLLFGTFAYQATSVDGLSTYKERLNIN